MPRPVLVLLSLACSREPVEGPLQGPGVDEDGQTLLSDAPELLVALTHLQVKNAPRPGRRFGDHADAIAEHLFEHEPPGWHGAAFRNVGRLDWWTMTVWTSEDAMLDFVVSEPHAAAITDLAEVAVGAESRSLWIPADDLPLSWDRALALLTEEQDFRYGASDWSEGS